MPRLDLLKRRVSKEYHTDALLGAYWILVDYDGRIPLDAPLRGKKRGRVRIVYPDSKGHSRPYTASKAEMDYLVGRGRPIQVLMAEEYFGPYVPQLPELDGLLVQIALLKEASETDPKKAAQRTLLKTIVNSIYGCLAESRHGETELTCWPLAAELTGRTRAKIWKAWDELEARGGIIVSVNTDSIRFVLPQERWTDLFPMSQKAVGEFSVKFLDATVTHYQSGIALIEEPEKAPHLRKRGKPLLALEGLRGENGPVLRVPTRRPTHLWEGIIQDRREDIGAFSDPNDPKDDSIIDLRSNLWAMEFDESLLRFETLNQRAVVGYAPDFDDLTRGVFVARAKRAVRGTKRPEREAPELSRSQPSRAPPRTGPHEKVPALPGGPVVA